MAFVFSYIDKQIAQKTKMEIKSEYRILIGKPEGKRLLGRPRCRR